MHLLQLQNTLEARALKHIEELEMLVKTTSIRAILCFIEVVPVGFIRKTCVFPITFSLIRYVKS